MKKFVAVALLVAGSAFLSGAAFANADDAKWVATCIKDNADAKVSIEVVTKYCTCMTAKMEDSETQTVSQWEKAHAKERTECEKDAGWN